MSFDVPAFEYIKVESNNVFAQLSTIFFYPGRLFFGRRVVPLNTKNFSDIDWNNNASPGLLDSSLLKGSFKKAVSIGIRICLIVPTVIGTGLMQLAIRTDKNLAEKNLEARKYYVHNEIQPEHFHNSSKNETQKKIKGLFSKNELALFLNDLWSTYRKDPTLYEKEGKLAANIYSHCNVDIRFDSQEIQKLEFESRSNEELTKYFRAKPSMRNPKNFTFSDLPINRQLELVRTQSLSDVNQCFSNQNVSNVFNQEIFDIFNDRIKQNFLKNDFSYALINSPNLRPDIQWIFSEDLCLKNLLQVLPSSSFLFGDLITASLSLGEEQKLIDSLNFEQFLAILCTSEFILKYEILEAWNSVSVLNRTEIRNLFLVQGDSFANNIRTILLGSRCLDKIPIDDLLQTVHDQNSFFDDSDCNFNESPQWNISDIPRRAYPVKFVSPVFLQLLRKEELFNRLSNEDLKKILINIYGYAEEHPIASLFEDSSSEIVQYIGD